MELQDLKNLPFDIQLTQAALTQLKLMLKQDFTLQDKFLRLSIKGKGCEGFTYSLQFTPQLESDVLLSISGQVTLLMDDFTAQFVKSGLIDFIQSHQEEGFLFQNHHEKLFHGKFFKELNLEQ
jgi:iron-sulfur cluster insertion protein